MDYLEKQKISLKIKEIIQNLQEERTSWVNIANIGIHLSANCIDYKQFGYQKLRPFLELFEDMGFEIEENPKEIVKEVNGKTPVVYMRIKDKVGSETSCPDNEKTNKRGFFRIGYLQNKNTYAEDIRKISGVSYINYEELNSYVERQWENKENTVLCFNQSNEKVSGDREDISFIMIDTGYKKEGSGDSIYGKFTRKDPGSLTNNGWLGVVIGIESELLAPEAPDLNKYTHITREKYKFIARTLTEMTEGEAVYDCSGCENLLKESYIDAIKNDTLSEMKSDTNDGKAISFFPLGNGICNKDGERIYVKTEKNTNPNKQKWYGAFLISEEDLKMELLSYFCYHVGYFKFENSNQCNTFFDNLAEMAMKEKWDFNNSQKSGVPYSILRSYLEFT